MSRNESSREYSCEYSRECVYKYSQRGFRRFLDQFGIKRMSCCLARKSRAQAYFQFSSPCKYEKDSGQVIHVTSDQHLISPNNMSALSGRQVVRTKKIVN